MATPGPPTPNPSPDDDRTPCAHLTLHGVPGEYPAGYVEVAAGVWAWLEPNGSWGETNAGLVVGDGEALLVDTLWDARLAERMLGAAADLLAGTPLTTAVITHRDGDHWWGNVALPAETEIWASEQTLAEIAVEPPPAALARLVTLSKLGRHLPGRVGRLSAYTVGMLGPFEFGGLQVRRPDRTFSGSRTLAVGGRRVDLLHLGPAHTEGDTVVHLPDDGVVFTGDLLFAGGTPVVWAGPVSSWISALDRLLALDAETYVPGHGPLAGRDVVREVRSYWEWVETATQEHFDAGRGVGEVIARLVTDPEFGRFRRWDAPERLALNVLARHRELTGAGPAGHDPLARMSMFSRVAELSRRLG